MIFWIKSFQALETVADFVKETFVPDETDSATATRGDEMIDTTQTSESEAYYSLLVLFVVYVASKAIRCDAIMQNISIETGLEIVCNIITVFVDIVYQELEVWEGRRPRNQR